jgi:hypothetical protein
MNSLLKGKRLILTIFVILGLSSGVLGQATAHNKSYNIKQKEVHLLSACKKFFINGFTYEKNDTLFISINKLNDMKIDCPLCVLNKNPYLESDSKFQFAMGTFINGDTIKTIYYSKIIAVFKIGLDVYYVFQNYFNNCMIHEIIPNMHANCTKKDAESIRAFSVVTFAYSKRKGIIGFRVIGNDIFGVIPYLNIIEE